MFGLVSKLMGGSRLSIVSLIIFFILGGALLAIVDEKEGIEVAECEEASFTLSTAMTPETP